MKNLFIFSLLFLPLFAFSQKDKVRFSIEKTAGFSDVVILSDGDFSGSSYIASLYKSKFAYDLGGLVNISLTEKLTLQTGVKAAILSFGQGGNELRWGSQHDGNGGWTNVEPDIELPTKIDFTYSTFYVEFPLRLNIQLSKKSDAFQLSLGQSPTLRMFQTSKSISTYPDRIEKNTSLIEADSQTRLLNMHTQLGFIWNKEMKNGSSFYLFPNARIQTFNQARQPALHSKYLFYGISLGITI
jgi:hypothetical protein